MFNNIFLLNFFCFKSKLEDIIVFFKKKLNMHMHLQHICIYICETGFYINLNFTFYWDHSTKNFISKDEKKCLGIN